MKKPKTTTTTTTTAALPLTITESTSHTPNADELHGSEPPSAPQPSAQGVEEETENGGDEVEESEGGEEDEEDYDEEDGDDEEEDEEGGAAERGSDGVEVVTNDDAVVAATTAEQMAKRQKLAEGFFEVEAIRKKRICKGEPQYLIKWRGWPESANTWEPVDHLQTCPDVVEAYEESLQSGQKKGSRKRKRKFTPQKKKGQYSYGVTKSKTSPVDISLSNEPQDSTALDQSKQANSEPSMADIAVKYEETRKRRSARKVDCNGSEAVSPHFGCSEKDHSDSAKLSGENASIKNLDLHSQQPVHVDGNGAANEQSKSTGVEAGQSNQQRGAKRRKSGSVRRFKQDETSFNVDCFGTPLPANVSSSGRVEQLMGGNSEASRKKKSDSSGGSSVITKIIKPISYSASVTNNIQDVSVTFVVMRSDGKEVMVDNKFLKATNPLLLINFYEQHLRYNPN